MNLFDCEYGKFWKRYVSHTFAKASFTNTGVIREPFFREFKLGKKKRFYAD
jgi:hypothetical protein